MHDRTARNEDTVAYGDFQTPERLCLDVLSVVAAELGEPASVVEPTCGLGRFLVAASKRFPLARTIGFDVNPDYIQHARDSFVGQGNAPELEVQDFFDGNWNAFNRALEGPVLYLGNPPWVTSSGLGILGRKNLPRKSNFQGHKGLDAQTGKSNFDISEWMLIQLMHAIEGSNSSMAFLIKTAVARKLFLYGVSRQLRLGGYQTYKVDAKKHFNVSVDAVLFLCRGTERATEDTMAAFDDLQREAGPGKRLGYVHGRLVSSPERFKELTPFLSEAPYQWRSGIKHDLSRILEVRPSGSSWINGLEEQVDVEEEYLYPLLKSSDVGGQELRPPRKWLVLPQRSLRASTDGLEATAPRLWAYLQKHRDAFERRKSSIYKKAGPFSLFGLGEYSFAN